ncbi:FAD-binding oxidoreductase [Nonomuraea zeae]|uniref:FAD-binding oxidoreductase n=1 Tax=Nonomuraea zeae TaxID=1642303 RepID=A0A5S4F866_9ACTN|nr:FAD-binding oxidoreductase [Nonomuraea zeae]TMR12680.1 FAD-binding oxidoreductase [Nonomuraea zeae]
MKSIIHRNSQLYDTERAGFQRLALHEPDLVVPAASPEDVREAVAHAAAAGLPVAVQAAGHGLPVPATEGLLINTNRLSSVTVDPVTATARIEAGARWHQVIAEAARHGLAPLSGSSPGVGAVPYTLGGGLSLMARPYGYAADQVRAIDVVTADAEPRHVTPGDDLHGDLYWALVGGRSNFGVVTALEIGLVPVERIYGGALYFDAGHAGEALRTWAAWTASLPDEMTSSIAIIPFPDAPQAPERFRGRTVATVRIAFTGGAEEGEDLVRPLRAIGPRLVDTVGVMPYTASASIHDDPTEPAGYYATHSVLRELPPAAVDALLDVTGCVVEVRHLGGALSKPQSYPNSVGNRDAGYSASLLSPGLAPGTDTTALRPAHDRARDALAPWSTGGRLLNFLYGENATPEEVRRAYEPADYRRLAELKAEWDPRNMFRLNHNIPVS